MNNIEEILSRLKLGNERFVNDQLESANQDSKRRETQTEGQQPIAIVLSCADSRVVPELIFDTGIGELFIVRVAGNVANTSSLASMEYAVAHLGTPLIVVLGHQSCGAVTAAVQGGDNGPNLNHLLEHLKPAIKQSLNPKVVEEVTRKNAELTVKLISKDSEIINKAVEDGKVKILPAYYYLNNGRVEFL